MAVRRLFPIKSISLLMKPNVLFSKFTSAIDALDFFGTVRFLVATVKVGAQTLPFLSLLLHLVSFGN